jgi:hypothetical protein
MWMQRMRLQDRKHAAAPVAFLRASGYKQLLGQRMCLRSSTRACPVPTKQHSLPLLLTLGSAPVCCSAAT